MGHQVPEREPFSEPGGDCCIEARQSNITRPHKNAGGRHSYGMESLPSRSLLSVPTRVSAWYCPGRKKKAVAEDVEHACIV